MVTPRLAREIRGVLEAFARRAGFSPASPVTIQFQPGTLGHHKVHRAADIYGVGGVGIGEWKRRWDRARREAAARSMPEERAAVMCIERRRNLGWRLYRAIVECGRWSQPYGYPIQVFGPWTRSEGPWRFISDGLLHAHRDHIHVAK